MASWATLLKVDPAPCAKLRAFLGRIAAVKATIHPEGLPGKPVSA